MDNFEKNGIEYSLISHEILDLNGGSLHKDIEEFYRFYEVMSYSGELRNSEGILTGTSLAILHHPVGMRHFDYFRPEFFWGSSSYKDVYSNEPEWAWLSVPEPTYSGKSGDLRLEENFKGRGIGSFLIRKIGDWLLENHPNAMLHPIHLARIDATDDNKVRRNSMYEAIGIKIDYDDLDTKASGRSADGTVSQLIMMNETKPVKDHFKVLTPKEHEALLLAEQAAAAALKVAEAERAKSGLTGMIRGWFR